MKVLVTGANGYIGLRLIPTLLEAGHHVVAQVRNPQRFPSDQFIGWGDQLEIIEADFLVPDTIPAPESVGSIDAAYYLLHSMGTGKGFSEKEAQCATAFADWIGQTPCQQIVYLSGIIPQGTKLSQHLSSRSNVLEILANGRVPLTTLQASIIVGSGSASFEIIRDLVEKLPFMITPKWARTNCQPIAIRNVIHYLLNVIDPKLHEHTLGERFDIGGPEVMTYQSMLEGYADVRGLHRWIVPVPFFNPKLSSYWLYFITATNFALASALVDSLHLETTCSEKRITELIPQPLLTYHEAIEAALSRIAQDRVPSAWYSSLASGQIDTRHIRNINVPQHGVFHDRRSVPITAPREHVINAIWSLGGRHGWPSLDWAWRLRGFLDLLVGGIGVRRGRRHPTELRTGDALDFWRVIVSDRPNGRLILFAEMKLPGEAWLEFELVDDTLHQRATFRPRGLFGRLYWAGSYPFHVILFPQMLKRLAAGWPGREV
ncbi:SDR family oxidoreductase [Sulfuriroseicoccus oceanibius]|uniref:SDR family oxidoreductase n=1 Tax=Sulfuriroseicoccus oceanibius TaxID=2707525 RepID=A0A6B3LEB7_9BACT|nr:SDR family oxidoreductase [Sulfuriroseicoccus oceanibius]QQL45403.1 SDR family oxidoreductase [Sulfuriroseicoccus oceanibius]